MFLFELAIYAAFAWIMCSLALKSERVYGNDSHIDRYQWWYMLFFAAVSAIRWRVGVDSTEYIRIFREGVVREDSTEYLWDWLVTTVHGLDLPFFIGTGLVAFLQIFFLTRAVKGNKFILVWLPIILFGGRYYLDLMNVVRQMVVACGYVYLSRYIVDRKLLKFVAGILLLSLIHHSALILLPTYLLAYIPLNRILLPDKKYVSLAILLVCFVAGQTPTFQSVFNSLGGLITSSGYENYSEYLAETLENETEVLSTGPIMISFLLTSMAVIWYAPVLQEQYAHKIKYFTLWYFFSFFFSCTYFLVCNLSHVVIRPFQYFEFYLVLMLALLLQYFYDNMAQYKKQFYMVLFFICLCTIVGVYKAGGAQYDFMTYKTYFGRL